MGKFGVYTYYDQPHELLWMGEATSPVDACAAALSDLWIEATDLVPVSPDVDVGWDVAADPYEYLAVLALDDLRLSIEFELLDAIGSSIDEDQRSLPSNTERNDEAHRPPPWNWLGSSSAASFGMRARSKGPLG